VNWEKVGFGSKHGKRRDSGGQPVSHCDVGGRAHPSSRTPCPAWSPPLPRIPRWPCWPQTPGGSSTENVASGNARGFEKCKIWGERGGKEPRKELDSGKKTMQPPRNPDSIVSGRNIFEAGRRASRGKVCPPLANIKPPCNSFGLEQIAGKMFNFDHLLI